MKLNIPERLALLSVMPQEGSIITLRIIRELQSELSFTENEIKLYGINNRMLPNGDATITWDTKMTDEAKEVKIGNAAKGIILAQLKSLDSQGKLHISMIPIYEKFVEGKK